jgi:hypothetical protein
MVVIEINGATTVYLLWFSVLLIVTMVGPLATLGEWLIRFARALRPPTVIHNHSSSIPYTPPTEEEEKIISEEGLPAPFWLGVEP